MHRVGNFFHDGLHDRCNRNQPDTIVVHVGQERVAGFVHKIDIGQIDDRAPPDSRRSGSLPHLPQFRDPGPSQLALEPEPEFTTTILKRDLEHATTSRASRMPQRVIDMKADTTVARAPARVFAQMAATVRRQAACG
jgi:hypothetical protein